MQQRYYDPAIGRFLSVDPVTALDNGDMHNFNRYAYAYNNPYKFTDPDGQLAANAFGAIVGGVVGGVSIWIVGHATSGGDLKAAAMGAIGGGVGGAITGACLGPCAGAVA